MYNNNLYSKEELIIPNMRFSKINTTQNDKIL